jgi:hypothetical protein
MKKIPAWSVPEFLHELKLDKNQIREDVQHQIAHYLYNAIDTTSALSNLPGFIVLAEDNKNNNQAPDYYYILSSAEERDGNIVQTFAAGVYVPGTTQGNGQGTAAFKNKALNKLLICPNDCKKVVAVKNRLALP